MFLVCLQKTSIFENPTPKPRHEPAQDIEAAKPEIPTVKIQLPDNTALSLTSKTDEANTDVVELRPKYSQKDIEQNKAMFIKMWITL